VTEQKNRVIDLEDLLIESPSLLFGHFHSIKFTRCKFKYDVTLYNIEVIENVEFIDCSFLTKAKLIFESGIFHGDVTLGIRELQRLQIQGGNFKRFILGYWGNFSSIKEVNIANISECSGTIHLSRAMIESVYICGENQNTFLTIQDITANLFNISHLHTNIPIRLFNIKSLKVPEKNSEFNVQHSTLGESVFFGVDFDSFTQFNIRQSFIGQTKFITCHLKKGIGAQVGRGLSRNAYEQLKSEIEVIKNHADALREKIPDDPSISNMEARILELSIGLKDLENKEIRDIKMFRRENYKQMKISAQNIGDTVNEKRFHAMEMCEYLEMETKCSDWLILWLSKWSSNFGQSLFRPIVFHVIIIHLLLFSIYFCFSNPKGYYLSCTDGSWKVFWEGFSVFWFLILPFRDLSLDNHGLLDLAFRVNSGFFIYNLLRATRKFYQ